MPCHSRVWFGHLLLSLCVCLCVSVCICVCVLGAQLAEMDAERGDDDDGDVEQEVRHRKEDLKILHQTMAQRGEAEGLSNDWLDFNEAVSMIVEQEGALLNSHKMAIKQQKMILAEEEPLLASVMVRCLRTWPSSVVGASVHPLAVASPQTSLSTTSTGMWPSWTSCCVRRSGCVAS